MKKYFVLLAVVLLLLAAGLLHSYGSSPEPVEEPLRLEPPYMPSEAVDETITLTFSETGHFIKRNIIVGISASRPDARIYYTLDGSVPTSLSMPYSGSLFFVVREEMQVVVLRAVAVYGGVMSRPHTHTFFIGNEIDERFGSEMLIFSLSAEPYDLFDHYSGILVEGHLREMWRSFNPRRNIIPTDPANFNWRGREGERPVNVEVFTASGERVISQGAGLRVHGAWSRAYEQRSFRLLPRQEYEPGVGRFNYQFFPGDKMQDGSGNPIERYNALILRNGANDRRFGMLRNEVGSVLAREAGFHAVTPVRPAAVFLNGEYWGFAWLQVRLDAHYLQELFNAPTREFDVVGNGEYWFDTDDDYLKDALIFKNSFAYKNLRNDAEFTRLQEILDVEDKLLYYAFQIFMGNGDWPHNNLRRWRYTGEQTEGLPLQLDGRWRYAIFDLDWVLGLYGDDHNLPTFQRVLESNDAGALIRNILTRPDMQRRFAEIMQDIIEVASTRNVRDTIALLFGWAEQEIDYALAAGKYDNWVSRYSIDDNHANMIRFATRRGRVMNEGMERLFGAN